jgi:ComF family protein
MSLPRQIVGFALENHKAAAREGDRGDCRQKTRKTAASFPAISSVPLIGSPKWLIDAPILCTMAGMTGWIRLLQDGIENLIKASCGLLFPASCIYCGVELSGQHSDHLFCSRCLASFGPMAWHGCKRCGRELSESDSASDDCQFCRNIRLRFDTVIPLGGYRAELRHAILQMKRPAHDALSMALGRLLAERRREQLAAVKADMIVPVPMFWTRRFRRGKNNPELLANCLAKSLKIPLRPKALVRHRNTSPQVGLARTRRFENVRGAFRVRNPEIVSNARILLVDDVLTTGATCSEAARALKLAGAAMVAVAVVARTSDAPV